MLGVVASTLPVLCKQLHQLPIILGPAVHRGKDTTHKILETMYFAHAWPQQCWKSCTDNNGSNTVVLRFGDHRTEEMLEVVGPKFWLVSNFRQQLPKIDDSMQQHGTGCADVTSDNFGSYWLENWHENLDMVFFCCLFLCFFCFVFSKSFMVSYR